MLTSRSIHDRFVSGSRCGARGFSLIELMIAIVVVAVLLSFGFPAFQTWLQNSQIRTAAESLKNGIQFARAEAVRLNTTVAFKLTNDTESGWKVNPTSDPDQDPPLGQRVHGEGSANATVLVTPAGSDEVVFGPFGQVISDRPTPPVTQLDVSNSIIESSPDIRKLRVMITAGGFVRLCDPKVTASGDPRRCI